MVQVRVGGVALDSAGQHVILLAPIEGGDAERILPIWIGAQEAASILIAIEGAHTPRPLAHDLMRTMLDTLGASLERAEVVRIDGGTFYATLTVRTADGVREIDARPSDAVALASRTGAPIHVADDVLAEAGVANIIASGSDDGGDDLPDVSVDEFKRFLDDVDPDDFRG